MYGIIKIYSSISNIAKEKEEGVTFLVRVTIKELGENRWQICK